jgi:acyl phosphate:glycerol-3-phosphate acyltransferase
MLVWTIGPIACGIGYLLGSTPTGYLAGKLLNGIDLREVGSKSTGATNVLRTLGVAPFVAVLLIDILKGVLAVLLVRWLCEVQPVRPGTAANIATATPWVVCLGGLGVLLGHARPFWLNFTGGKSAAAGLGVLLATSWPVGLGVVTVVAVSLSIFRIMSASSMLGALTAILLVFLLDQPLPYRLLVTVGAAYVIIRHRANMQRLLAGTEPRLRQNPPSSTIR